MFRSDIFPYHSRLEAKHNHAIISTMWLYGLSGFIVGFVLGMILNARLLRGVAREQYLKDSNLRLRYGLLNWGVALIGMMIGLYLARYV